MTDPYKVGDQVKHENLTREKVYDTGREGSEHFIALRDHVFTVIDAVKGDRELSLSKVAFGQGDIADPDTKSTASGIAEAIFVVFPDPAMNTEDYIEMVTRLNDSTECIWELHTNTEKVVIFMGIYLITGPVNELIKA